MFFQVEWVFYWMMIQPPVEAKNGGETNKFFNFKIQDFGQIKKLMV